MGSGNFWRAGEPQSRLVVLAPVVVLAIWAAGWVLVNTAHGIDHVDPDGASYIGTADQIRAGAGPTVPFTSAHDQLSPHSAVALAGDVPSTHFPPGYPYAIAAVSVVSGDTRSAARVINVGCAFFDVLLLGVLAARLTSYRSMFAAAAPVVLVLFVPDRLLYDGPGWLQVFLGVYSEPLFTLCILGAVLAASSALTDPSTKLHPSLVVAATLGAAAFFIRYAGIALVLTLVVAFTAAAVFERRAGRLRQALVLGVTGVLPMLLFSAWSTTQGAGGARTVAYHLPGGGLKMIERIGRFVVPYGWSSGAQAAAGGITVALMVAAVCWRPQRVRERWADDEGATMLQRLVLLFIVAYVAVLVATRIFLDISTPYDARLLAPIRGVAYALIVAVAYRYLVVYARSAVVGLVAAAAIAALIHADWSLERYWFAHADSTTRRLTATEKALEAVPRDALVVTNAPHVAYLTAGRSSLVLPSRSLFLTNETNRAYHRQLSEWARILKDRGGYGFFASGVVGVTPSELADLVPLQLISRSGGESLYRVRHLSRRTA